MSAVEDDFRAFVNAGEARDATTEIRPLGEISSMADNLSRMADALDEWLERFNGPRPVDPETPSQPPCYRSEITRLDGLVRRVGSITDAIAKLG